MIDLMRVCIQRVNKLTSLGVKNDLVMKKSHGKYGGTSKLWSHYQDPQYYGLANNFNDIPN